MEVATGGFESKRFLNTILVTAIARGGRLVEETLEQPRYVLVIRIPRRVEIVIEDIFLELVGTTKAAIGYHITLAGSFILPDGADHHGLSFFESACHTYSPITVRLAGLGSFRAPGSSVVFLRVADAEAMVDLHRQIVRDLNGRIAYANERAARWNAEGYLPHVTLGLGLTDRELAAFLENGDRRVLDETFRAEEIWLAEQQPDEPWRYVSSYQLGELKTEDADSLAPHFEE